jgi:hypothetical protein
VSDGGKGEGTAGARRLDGSREGRAVQAAAVQGTPGGTMERAVGSWNTSCGWACLSVPGSGRLGPSGRQGKAIASWRERQAGAWSRVASALGQTHTGAGRVVVPRAFDHSR